MFADNLRKHRTQRGWSLRTLAHRAGLKNHVNIHHIEKGRHNPRPHTARALADALGVDVEDLYNGNSRQSETTTRYLIQ